MASKVLLANVLMVVCLALAVAAAITTRLETPSTVGLYGPPAVIEPRLYGAWDAVSEASERRFHVTPYVVMLCSDAGQTCLQADIDQHRIDGDTGSLSGTIAASWIDSKRVPEAGLRVRIDYRIDGDRLDIVTLDPIQLLQKLEGREISFVRAESEADGRAGP